MVWILLCGVTRRKCWLGLQKESGSCGADDGKGKYD